MGQLHSTKNHPLPIADHSADCYLNKLGNSDVSSFLTHIQWMFKQFGAKEVINNVASINVNQGGYISTKYKHPGIIPASVNLMKYKRICSIRKRVKEFERILTYTVRRNERENVNVYLPCQCEGRYVGLDINTWDAYGRLPLNISIRQKDLDLTRLLLQCGADIKACDIYGRSPLHVACEIGDIEITRLLVASGSDVNQFDNPSLSSMVSIHLTPLAVAAMHQNAQCMNILLNAGADPNIPEVSSLNTPLHKCCVHGYTTCANVLLNHCAYGNLKNADGITPLQLALIHRNIDITRKLLKYGCDVTNYNQSLPSILSFAAMCGQLEIVKQCLKAGENVNRADQFNYTALYYTITLDTYSLWMHNYLRANKIEFTAHSQITGRKEIVEMLIHHGANVQSVIEQTQRDCILTKKHFTLSQNIAIFLKVIQATGFSTFTSEELYKLFTLMLHENGSTVAKLLLAANPRLNTRVSYELRDVVDWQGIHCKEAELSYLQTVSGADSITAVWIHERISKPRPLQEWCRDTIRQCLATNVFYNVTELEIPKQLKDYICLRDMVAS